MHQPNLKKMKPLAKFKIYAHIMAKEIDGECMLLDVANGIYFGLNRLGLRIWQLLTEEKSSDEICIILLNEFDVPRETLENDVSELLQDLLKNGLITQLILPVE